MGCERLKLCSLGGIIVVFWISGFMSLSEILSILTFPGAISRVEVTFCGGRVEFVALTLARFSILAISCQFCS